MCEIIYYFVCLGLLTLLGLLGPLGRFDPVGSRRRLDRLGSLVSVNDVPFILLSLFCLRRPEIFHKVCFRCPSGLRGDPLGASILFSAVISGGSVVFATVVSGTALVREAVLSVFMLVCGSVGRAVASDGASVLCAEVVLVLFVDVVFVG